MKFWARALQLGFSVWLPFAVNDGACSGFALLRRFDEVDAVVAAWERWSRESGDPRILEIRMVERLVTKKPGSPPTVGKVFDNTFQFGYAHRNHLFSNTEQDVFVVNPDYRGRLSRSSTGEYYVKNFEEFQDNIDIDQFKRLEVAIDSANYCYSILDLPGIERASKARINDFYYVDAAAPSTVARMGVSENVKSVDLTLTPRIEVVDTICPGFVLQKIAHVHVRLRPIGEWYAPEVIVWDFVDYPSEGINMFLKVTSYVDNMPYPERFQIFNCDEFFANDLWSNEFSLKPISATRRDIVSRCYFDYYGIKSPVRRWSKWPWILGIASVGLLSAIVAVSWRKFRK